MSEPYSKERRKNSPRFVLLFIVIVLMFSAGVFVTFTYFQRSMASSRQQYSALNLVEIRKLLLEDQKRTGRIPSTPAELFEVFKNQETILHHPSWSGQPGYVWVSGSDLVGGDADDVVIFENVPASKKMKVGCQSIDVNGLVARRSNAEMAEVLGRQEAKWKLQGRAWRLVEMRAENGSRK